MTSLPRPEDAARLTAVLQEHPRSDPSAAAGVAGAAGVAAVAGAGRQAASFGAFFVLMPRHHPRQADVAPRCVRLRVLLLGCRPERVLPGERSSVIVAGHVAAGERVGLRIRACLPVGERVRVPEPPLVPVSDPDLGSAHIRSPDADADHIGTDIGAAERTPVFRTRNFGTACVFCTARVHAGEHSIIRLGTRVCVAANW